MCVRPRARLSGRPQADRCLAAGRVDGLRVQIVADEEALRANYRDMESELRPNVMIQQYIPGPSEFGMDDERLLRRGL